MQKRFGRNTAIIWIFLFCLTQLSGCSFLGRRARPDGPPLVDIDVSKIHDAVPRVEPRSAYGNNDYVVYGHKYHVLASSKGYDKVGTASWYGTRFHGHATSNRERYNLYDVTAASTVLPLPTYVQVTNLSNGKKIIVRVNDRGPFRCHRIIDLSYAAAKKLGYANIGTARVRVVAIDPRTWNKKIATKPKSKSVKSKNVTHKTQSKQLKKHGVNYASTNQEAPSQKAPNQKASRAAATSK